MTTVKMKYILAELYNDHFRPIECEYELNEIFLNLEYGDVKEGEYQIWEYPTGKLFEVMPDREVPHKKYYSPPSKELWWPQLSFIGEDKEKVRAACTSFDQKRGFFSRIKRIWHKQG